jgi:hypothetical protein
MARALGKSSGHSMRSPRPSMPQRLRYPRRSRTARSVFSTKRACPACGTSFFRARSAPVLVQLEARLVRGLLRHGPEDRGFDAEQSGEEIWWNDWFEGEAEPCPSCHGERLNPVARNVRFAASVHLAAHRAVGRRHRARTLLRPAFARRPRGRDRARPGRRTALAPEFPRRSRPRLSALDRAAPTLSGGEAQRIRLAAQLGSNLQGVCYILDEPTIGLHPRDNRILLDTLEKLAQGQHAARRRARRGHDPTRGSRGRPRPRRGRRAGAWSRRHGVRADGEPKPRSPAASCANRCAIRYSRAASSTRTAPVD